MLVFRTRGKPSSNRAFFGWRVAEGLPGVAARNLTCSSLGSKQRHPQPLKKIFLSSWPSPACCLPCLSYSARRSFSDVVAFFSQPDRYCFQTSRCAAASLARLCWPPSWAPPSPSWACARRPARWDAGSCPSSYGPVACNSARRAARL